MLSFIPNRIVQSPTDTPKQRANPSPASLADRERRSGAASRNGTPPRDAGSPDGEKAQFDLSESKVALSINGRDPRPLEVIRYEGVEGLSMLFHFVVELAVEGDVLPAAEFVGQRAALSFANPHASRCFHGLVSRYIYLGEGHGRSQYRLEIVPRLWLATQRYDSRIFQNMTVPQIVADVLRRAGITSPDFVLEEVLIDNHREREYCVQYRETDFNFISRLLEEEGIFYYLENRDDHCRMVIADVSMYRPIGKHDSTLRFQPPSGMHVSDEHVFAFQHGEEVRPGAVVLRDYNYGNPSLDLQSHGHAERDPHLAISDYPGNYDSQRDGRRIAHIRAEELECRRSTGYGRSNCARLAPGTCFKLRGHPSGTLNGAHIITRVTHRGRQAISQTFDGGEAGADLHTLPGAALAVGVQHGGEMVTDPAATAAARGGDPRNWLAELQRLSGLSAGALHADAPAYECDFECIPQSVTFRPPRIALKPVMRGTQTAVVVGPESNDPGTPIEIYTEAHGRVKVRFHWDREAGGQPDPTCWIRVSQPWAGKGFGGMTVPRIGQEVIVDFLEGDPDRPIIVGRVYNGESQAPQSMAAPTRMTGDGPKPITAMQDRPQTLPAAATRTLIRSNSTPGGGGANELTLDDQKGQELLHINATKDGVRTVGNNDTTTVGNNRDISVGANLDEFVAVNRSRRVGVDETVKVDANQDITVDANRSVTVKGNESHTVHMCRSKQVMISENILTGVSKTVETGLAHIETVGLLHALIVGMQRLRIIGMNDDLIVGADKCDKIYGNSMTSVGNEMGVTVGAKLVVECPDITLAAKGGFIRINGDGVTIKGTKVKINCSGAEAGKLSGTSTVAGGGGGAGGAGGAGGSAGGGAAGIVAGGCLPDIPMEGGLGGLLSSLGLDLNGLGGLLSAVGIDPKGTLGQVLSAIGQILPKIPGLDPNIASVLNTVLNDGVPSLEQVLGAVRERLPADAQKWLDAVLQAIRADTKSPAMPGKPTSPALPGTQGALGAGGATNNLVPDGSGGASTSGANDGAAFDADAAASHAAANAESAPTGMCGQYVREALEAGGVSVQSTGSAKDYGPNLETAGFHAIPASESTYVPQKGDVVVFQDTEGHPHGHIQIHDGTQFVSDFKQNDPLWPSSNPNSSWKQNKPSFTVYRHPGS